MKWGDWDRSVILSPNHLGDWKQTNKTDGWCLGPRGDTLNWISWVCVISTLRKLNRLFHFAARLSTAGLYNLWAQHIVISTTEPTCPMSFFFSREPSSALGLRTLSRDTWKVTKKRLYTLKLQLRSINISMVRSREPRDVWIPQTYQITNNR